jgi:sodium/bile acid cotransporter 7
VASFLVRRWFLLLLLAGLVVAWLWPGLLRPGVVWLRPAAVVALALFLMAWGLETRSLLRTLVRPWPVCWAVLISYGLMPLLAWLLGWLLADPGLRFGLLLMACVPCTLASAVLWTRMAGGHEPTALLVILATTATSWLVTPLALALLGPGAASLDVGALMRELLLGLVLPVGLGQLTRGIRPLARIATRYKAPLGVVSQLLVLVVILKAVIDAGDRLAETATTLPLGSSLLAIVLAVVLHLAGLYAGLWSSLGLGFDRASRIAVAFAGSQKTLPVALFVFDHYFKDAFPLAVVSLVFYHVGQLVVDTFIADGLRGRQSQPSPVPATDPGPEM